MHSGGRFAAGHRTGCCTIRLFSPQALLERLGSRLSVLRGGARDLPARQQALRDTIDWSYELLDAEEQRLFMLLSVFRGCSFDAAEQVAGSVDDSGRIDVLEVSPPWWIKAWPGW